MSFPKYESYKDSGVEWLGEVPAHWNALRTKFIVRSLEQGWSPQCEGYPAEADGWGVLKVGCVNGGIFRPEENKQLPADLEPIPSLSLSYGDVLISRANTRELVGSAAVIPADFDRLMLCDKLYRLRLDETQCSPTFLGLYLGTPAARSQIELDATGASSSMVNIGQGTILELTMPVPPLPEQYTIAAFLDRETAKIDALIAEQRRLIELLTEKRQAVISHAVTKGLDPNAPMKDLGLEWLGEVPEHWDAVRTKFIVRSLEQGWSPQCENYPAEAESWGVLKVGCVNGGIFRPEENKQLPADLEPIPSLALSQGDVLISRANTRELVGSAAVIPADFDRLMLCDKLYRLRLDETLCSPTFLGLYLGTPEARSQIELDATGASSSMVNIGQGTILELTTPLPPLNEQHAIAAFLDQETARIDALIAEAQRGIGLLQERRAVLISAAVTGKIDVRAAVAAQEGAG